MKVLFAGGGTAGHINPALAIARYIKDKEPDSQILYIGAKGGMEEILVPKSGFKFKGIKISGFDRKLNINAIKKNIITLKRIITSTQESKKILKEFKPDICIGTGGYVSGPVLRAASGMGIPIIIHEQNAFPGVTNKMLSKYAKKIMLAIPDAKKYFKHDCVITGNPVRKEVINANKEDSRKKLNLDTRPLILSFGGSLGANRINEAVKELIEYNAKTGKFQHIHGYGRYGKDFISDLENRGVKLSKCRNIDVREYIDNMAECMAAADLVICRAGAITISELQIQGKPAILIPSPNVAENHQYHNAMALVNANAASIIEEKDLTGSKLVDMVNKMLESEDTLKMYSINAKRMSIFDSCDRIYKVVKDVLE